MYRTSISSSGAVRCSFCFPEPISIFTLLLKFPQKASSFRNPYVRLCTFRGKQKLLCLCHPVYHACFHPRNRQYCRCFDCGSPRRSRCHLLVLAHRRARYGNLLCRMLFKCAFPASGRFRHLPRRSHVCLGDRFYIINLSGNFYAFLTFLAALFVGCFTQANAVTQTTELTFHISPYITGLVTVVLIASVILKGNHSIANACMKIVPVLGILYTLSCILLLWINRSALLPAIILIVKHALAPRAALGGAAGSSLMLTARFGIARGLFLPTKPGSERLPLPLPQPLNRIPCVRRMFP